MCNDCLRAAQVLAPDASEEDQISLLWACSPFPFGSPRDVYYAMRRCLRASKGDIVGAVRFALEDLHQEWGGRHRKGKPRHPLPCYFESQ